MAATLSTVARANLRAAKGKYFLTGIGISIAAFFISAVIVLTSSLQATIDASIGDIATKIDSVVVSAGTTDQSKRIYLDTDTVKKVREDPSIDAYWVLYQAPGKFGTGNNKVKVNYSQVPSKSEMFPFPIEGAMPTNNSEILVSKEFAKTHNLSIGTKTTSQDAVAALTNSSSTAEKEYKVTGIFETDLGSSGTNNYVYIGGTEVGDAILKASGNVSNSQSDNRSTEFSTPGVQYVYLKFKDGGGDDARAALEKKLDTGNDKSKPKVLSGQELLDTLKKQLAELFQYLGMFLGAFAVLALLVSSFVISNTFAVLIGQRIRELALLRTLGARGGSLVRMLLVESLIVGLIFSSIGAAVVYLVAWGIGALFKDFKIAYDPVAFIVAVITCTIVTVLASLAPAITALRISPMSALGETTNRALQKPRIIWLIIGLLAGLAGAFLTHRGLSMASGEHKDTGAALLSVLCAMLMLSAAVFLLAPWILLPMVRLFGSIFRYQTGRLAVANSLRAPKRTVSTGRAVLVGVLVVATVQTAYNVTTVSMAYSMDKAFPISAMTPFSNNTGEGSDSVKKAHKVAEDVKDIENVEAVAVAHAAGAIEYSVIPPNQDKPLARTDNLVSLSQDDLVKLIPAEAAHRLGDNEVLVPEALWNAGSFNDSTRLKAKGPKGEIELKPIKSDSKQMLFIVNPETGEKLQDPNSPKPIIPQGAQIPGTPNEMGSGIADPSAKDQTGQQNGEQGTQIPQDTTDGAQEQGQQPQAPPESAQKAPPQGGQGGAGAEMAGAGALGNQTVVLVHAKAPLSGADNVTLQNRLAKANDGTEFTGGLQMRQMSDQMMNILLGAVFALLALAIIISIIGIANTMTLSVNERRRENAMLRSLGLSRTQLWGMISLEAILITLAAVLVGILTGIGLGLLIIKVIFSNGPDMVINLPYTEMIIILVVGLISALVASALPAIRSTRQSPVEGLHA